MGLDFACEHNDDWTEPVCGDEPYPRAHWSYGGFAAFRRRLATAAGWPVPAGSRLPADLQWEAYDDKNFQGDWDRYPEDPLLVLIVHSDCDGVIHPDIAEAVAHRLRGLVAGWDDSHDRQHALLLADHLDHSAKHHHDLVFT